HSVLDPFVDLHAAPPAVPVRLKKTDQRTTELQLVSISTRVSGNFRRAFRSAATAIGQGAASRRKVGFGGLGAGPRRAYCSSSPYGEGCGPGMMPAMSGSSPVAAWGFDARRILASSRRAAFWFRF